MTWARGEAGRGSMVSPIGLVLLGNDNKQQCNWWLGRTLWVSPREVFNEHRKRSRGVRILLRNYPDFDRRQAAPTLLVLFTLHGHWNNVCCSCFLVFCLLRSAFAVRTDGYYTTVLHYYRAIYS